ncbi:hypothetical protein ACHAWF_016715 [Thalassiosira exigua]
MDASPFSAAAVPSAATAASSAAGAPPDPPRPKRPLSGYNLFYRYKRNKVLEELARPPSRRDLGRPGSSSADAEAAAIDGILRATPGLEGHPPHHPVWTLAPQQVDEYRGAVIRREMEGKIFPNENARNRLHRKVHGMGFVEMGRVMRDAWASVDGFTKELFCELAEVGRARYRTLLAEYKGAKLLGGGAKAAEEKRRDSQVEGGTQASAAAAVAATAAGLPEPQVTPGPGSKPNALCGMVTPGAGLSFPSLQTSSGNKVSVPTSTGSAAAAKQHACMRRVSTASLHMDLDMSEPPPLCAPAFGQSRRVSMVRSVTGSFNGGSISGPSTVDRRASMVGSFGEASSRRASVASSMTMTPSSAMSLDPPSSMALGAKPAVNRDLLCSLIPPPPLGQPPASRGSEALKTMQASIATLERMHAFNQLSAMSRAGIKSAANAMFPVRVPSMLLPTSNQGVIPAVANVVSSSYTGGTIDQEMRDILQRKSTMDATMGTSKDQGFPGDDHGEEQVSDGDLLQLIGTLDEALDGQQQGQLQGQGTEQGQGVGIGGWGGDNGKKDFDDEGLIFGMPIHDVAVHKTSRARMA